MHLEQKKTTWWPAMVGSTMTASASNDIVEGQMWTRTKENNRDIRLYLFGMVLLVLLFSSHTARAYYDSGTQRWLNRDPIQEFGGRNLFLLARNNPMNLADGYGLVPCPRGTHCPPNRIIQNNVGIDICVCAPDCCQPDNPPPTPPPTTCPCGCEGSDCNCPPPPLPQAPPSRPAQPPPAPPQPTPPPQQPFPSPFPPAAPPPSAPPPIIILIPIGPDTLPGFPGRNPPHRGPVTGGVGSSPWAPAF